MGEETGGMKIPFSEVDAARSIQGLIGLSPERLMLEVGDDEIREAWCAIAYLFAGLRPDDVPGRGAVIHARSNHVNLSSVPDDQVEWINPYDEISGWPVVLITIAQEVRRRYMADRLTDEEYYPSAAQRAGMIFRNPELAQTE